MSRTGRVVVVVAVGFGVVILSWVALIGAICAWGGVATVRISDPRAGSELYLPVPMALVDVVLASAAAVTPQEDWPGGVGGETADWGPLIGELLAELERCPDATLVEVEDAGERVRVFKEGGRLGVEVDADEVSVRLSMPVRSTRRAVARLAGAV